MAESNPFRQQNGTDENPFRQNDAGGNPFRQKSGGADNPFASAAPTSRAPGATPPPQPVARDEAGTRLTAEQSQQRLDTQSPGSIPSWGETAMQVVQESPALRGMGLAAPPIPEQRMTRPMSPAPVEPPAPAPTQPLQHRTPEATPGTMPAQPAPQPQVTTPEERAHRFAQAAQRGTEKAARDGRNKVAATQPLQQLRQQMEQAGAVEPMRNVGPGQIAAAGMDPTGEDTGTRPEGFEPAEPARPGGGQFDISRSIDYAQRREQVAGQQYRAEQDRQQELELRLMGPDLGSRGDQQPPLTPLEAMQQGMTREQAAQEDVRRMGRELTPEAMRLIARKWEYIHEGWPTQTAEGGAEDQLRQATVEAQLGVIGSVPTAPGRAAVAGVAQAGGDTISLLSRGAEWSGMVESGGADTLNRLSGDFGEAVRQSNEDAWTPEMVNNAVQGATRSITNLLTARGAGSAVGASGTVSIVSGFTANAANQAITEGRDAGLEGKELASYAAGQGAIEGVITSAFQLVGMGGLESVKAPAREGIKAGLRQLGIRSLAEVPEELVIELTSQFHNNFAGVNEQNIDPRTEEGRKNLFDMAAQTTLTTLATVGLAEGGQRLAQRGQRSQQDDDPETQQLQAEFLQQRARETQQTPHEATADPEGTDPLTQRLLDAGFTEQQIARMDPDQVQDALGAQTQEPTVDDTPPVETTPQAQPQQTVEEVAEATQAVDPAPVETGSEDVNPFVERTMDEEQQGQPERTQDPADPRPEGEPGRLPGAAAEVGQQAVEAEVTADDTDVQAQRSVSAYLDGDTAPLQEWLIENDPAYAELDQQLEQAELEGRSDDADALVGQMEDMEIERVTQVAPPEALQRATTEDTTDATPAPVEPTEVEAATPAVAPAAGEQAEGAAEPAAVEGENEAVDTSQGTPVGRQINDVAPNETRPWDGAEPLDLSSASDADWSNTADVTPVRGGMQVRVWNSRGSREGTIQRWTVPNVNTAQEAVRRARRQYARDIAESGITAEQAPVISDYPDLAPQAAPDAPAQPDAPEAVDTATPVADDVSMAAEEGAGRSAQPPQPPERPSEPATDRDGSPLEDLTGQPVPRNEDGTVTLYHRTTLEAANRIRETGRFVSAENTDEVFLSTTREGNAEGYGDAVVEVKVDPSIVRLDDAFQNGEVHVAVKSRDLSRITPSFDQTAPDDRGVTQQPSREQLEVMTARKLRDRMREMGIPPAGRTRKAQFVDAILEQQAAQTDAPDTMTAQEVDDGQEDDGARRGTGTPDTPRQGGLEAERMAIGPGQPLGQRSGDGQVGMSASLTQKLDDFEAKAKQEARDALRDIGGGSTLFSGVPIPQGTGKLIHAASKIAAAKIAKSGIRAGQAVRQALTDLGVDASKVRSQIIGRIQRSATRIVREARDEQGNITSDGFDRAIAAADERVTSTAQQPVKKQVREATGQTQTTRRKNIRKSEKDLIRERWRQRAKREREVEQVREKMQAQLDRLNQRQTTAAKARTEIRKLVQQNLPPERRGRYLRAVAEAKTARDINNAVHRIQQELARLTRADMIRIVRQAVKRGGITPAEGRTIIGMIYEGHSFEAIGHQLQQDRIATEEHHTDLSPDAFDHVSPTLWRRLLTWGQDKMREVWEVQRAIGRDEGKDSALEQAARPEDQDTYLADELRSRHTQTRIETAFNRYIRPLTKVLANNDIPISNAYDKNPTPDALPSFNTYVIARHAQERNRVIREQTFGELADLIPGLADESVGSGMSDALAESILTTVAASDKRVAYERAARLFDRMNKRYREVLGESGLESQDTLDQWGQMFERYAPLRTDMSALEPELAGVGRTLKIGGGVNISGREQERARGRRTLADDPLAFAWVNLQNGLVRAEKNKVGRTFLTMVQANPNSNLWRVLAPDQTPQPGWKTVSTKVDGREVRVAIAPQHAGLAKALKNMGVEDQGLLMRNIARATRTLAGLSTRWNPVFPPINLMRDVIGVNLTVTGEKGLAIAAAVNAKIPQSFWALYGQKRKGLAPRHLPPDQAKKWNQWAEEYRESGAPIAFLDLNTLQDTTTRLRRELRDAEQTNNPLRYAWKALRSTGHLIGDLNDAAENAARLAVYATMREQGMSKARAASYAKNISTNFERKGNVGSLVNGLYMFANAGIQGNARVLSSAMRHKGTRRVVVGLFGASVALDLLNYLLAGEDDDGENYYDKMPDYVKRNNIILPLWDDEGNTVMIPAPFVYNWVQGLAQSTTAAVMGRKGFGEAAAEIGSSAFDTFNPLGGSAGDPVLTLTPTVIKPLVEVNRNEDWKEAPVYPAPNPYATWDPPKSEQHFKGTPDWLVASTQWLNRQTGGDAFRRGAVDVHPDVVNHILEFATGGAGRSVGQGVNLTHSLAQGKEIEAYQVPLYRRFRYPTNPRIMAERFYDEYKDEIERLHAMDRADEELSDDQQSILRLRPRMRDMERQIKDLREQRDTHEHGTDAWNKVDDEINQEFAQFNKLYGDVAAGEAQPPAAGGRRRPTRPSRPTRPTR